MRERLNTKDTKVTKPIFFSLGLLCPLPRLGGVMAYSKERSDGEDGAGQIALRRLLRDPRADYRLL